MFVAFEDDLEPTKTKPEHVRSCTMATSEVDLEWILLNVIIANDDNDNDNDTDTEL